MSLEEAGSFIGEDRLWLVPGGSGKILVGVEVVDARVSFGRDQIRIQPLAGRGARWVDLELTQEVED